MRPLNDPTSPATAPFPSDRWTVADSAQLTGRRVALPLPADCVAALDDCEDVAVLNTLDGFSAEPRVSIPFDGDIDPASVNSDRRSSSQTRPAAAAGRDRPGRVGSGDPHAARLGQGAARAACDYALVVTRGVRDSDGDQIANANGFEQLGDVAVASIFTVQSTTAMPEKIAAQIHAAPPPAPVDFAIAPGGQRAVFDLAAVQAITHTRQVNTAGGVQTAAADLPAIRFVPGAVGRIAYGRFSSPSYLVGTSAHIPPVPTRTGVPAVKGSETVYLTLAIPAGKAPKAGWPVALVGHGATGNKEAAAFQYSSILASKGIATLAINQVGRGWGPQSTVSVTTTGGAVTTFKSGGRGIDQNGDTIIALREGDEATAPRRLIANRDTLQQHVADLLALVRVIGVGVDVDGDGRRDLDPRKISYLGLSLGTVYGSTFVALEPAIEAAALSVVGGPLPEGRRLQARFRNGLGALFRDRRPSLWNPPGITMIDGVTIPCPCFDENLPFRSEPPITNDVAGAPALQQWFDRAGWAAQSSNAVAWAPYLPRKRLIMQFARADQSGPNPTNRNVIAAGDLRDRSTLYRHDLYFADHPNPIKDPHDFITPLNHPVMGPIAVAAQTQAATFLASRKVIDPDTVIGTSGYFETGMSEASVELLETLGWIP